MWPTLFHIPYLNMPIRGYGLMLMIAFLGGTWWATQRAVRVKANPDLVVNIGFIALVFSVIGARIFYVVHYWERFAGQGLWKIVDVTAGGLEFYGGFIGAFAAVMTYMWMKRMPVRLYADIVAPSLMFGMGAARVGCFLNGCCWGGPCPESLPWGVTFPYASGVQYRQWEERMMTLPAELIMMHSSGVPYPLPQDALGVANQAGKGTAQARQEPLTTQSMKFGMSPAELDALAQRPEYQASVVHPVQLYASINGLVMAGLLNVVFYRRRRHGVVFALLLLLYPACRVVEEMIRIDNPHDMAGMTASQFVSLFIFASGLIWLWAIRRMPQGSPQAVPWSPMAEPARPAATRKGK